MSGTYYLKKTRVSRNSTASGSHKSAPAHTLRTPSPVRNNKSLSERVSSKKSSESKNSSELNSYKNKKPPRTKRKAERTKRKSTRNPQRRRARKWSVRRRL